MKLRYLLVLLLPLLLFCGYYGGQRSLRLEVRDLEVQLAESRQKVDTFYIHDSIPVWRERVVEVDKTDYARHLADRELLKSLSLRLSQVESENRMLLSARDTIYLSAFSDSVLGYSDEWVTFSYQVPSGLLRYAVRDSLTTIVSRNYRHRFLFFRWGTKGYDVNIVNHNPHSRVEYNKYISVKR